MKAAIVSNAIDKIGFASVASFVGIKTSEQAGIIEPIQASAEWGLAEWGIMFSIVGTVSFAAKNILEMYLAWNKRDK